MRKGDRVKITQAEFNATRYNGRTGTVTNVNYALDYPIEVEMDGPKYTLCFRREEVEPIKDGLKHLKRQMDDQRTAKVMRDTFSPIQTEINRNYLEMNRIYERQMLNTIFGTKMFDGIVNNVEKPTPAKKEEPQKEVAYISGSMTGVEDHNRARFDEIEEIVAGMGYEVINPARLDIEEGMVDKEGNPLKWQNFMRRDIRIIAERADLVVCFDDWENSRGATDEAYVAAVMDIPVYRLVKNPGVDTYTLEDVDLPAPMEAKRLVLGDRRGDYGHPLDNFNRTVDLLNARLAEKLSEPLTVLDFADMMVLVKMARQLNAPKRDNIVDSIGYLYTAEACAVEMKRRGEDPERFVSDRIKTLRENAVDGAFSA